MVFHFLGFSVNKKYYYQPGIAYKYNYFSWIPKKAAPFPSRLVTVHIY